VTTSTTPKQNRAPARMTETVRRVRVIVPLAYHYGGNTPTQ
jgi:hypothetical protein